VAGSIIATIIAVQPDTNGTNPPMVFILAPLMACILLMVLAWYVMEIQLNTVSTRRVSPGRRFSRLRHCCRTEGANELLLSTVVDLHVS
jgi:hypothetical protein